MAAPYAGGLIRLRRAILDHVLGGQVKPFAIYRSIGVRIDKPEPRLCYQSSHVSIAICAQATLRVSRRDALARPSHSLSM